MSTEAESAARLVAEDALARTRSVVCPALRAAVEALPEPVCGVAGYHLGWRDAGGASVADSSGGGKVLRATVALLAAEAASAGGADAVPAAVAVELVHNFSLLHDDIMDGDRMRRHRPAAWTVFGAAAAILAGDALLNLAVRTLAWHDSPCAAGQVRMLTDAVAGLLAGQGTDVEFENQAWVEYGQYREMAARKTGALLAAAAGLGGLAGGADPEQVGHLQAYGRHLGLAFQYVDDLLGIWGDPACTGKPATSDLRRRKKTLPVVLALTTDSPAAHELATYYRAAHTPTDAETAHAAHLIDVTGARERTQQHADRELGTALTHLRATGLPGPTTALHDLATHLATRTH